MSLPCATQDTYTGGTNERGIHVPWLTKRSLTSFRFLDDFGAVTDAFEAEKKLPPLFGKRKRVVSGLVPMLKMSDRQEKTRNSLVERVGECRCVSDEYRPV